MGKKKTSRKFKVYSLTCPETDVTGLICPVTSEVGDFIQGDIENNPEQEEFNYTITAKRMTNKQLDALPEYEP